ncbi:dynein axonemal heavy chain 5 isoform X1 [Hydra vulgaris]|uniref:dynein axonemal heavy chain 5 isoform X1 n=2 Tax=Hydra vulgaris TaxID=6087 RepID=UPI001F5E77AA|nr:dynein axonemal heavy chain 5 isoform X1 [Hydra vulgaris]
MRKISVLNDTRDPKRFLQQERFQKIELNRVKLDDRHNYVFMKISQVIFLDEQTVQEHLLNDEKFDLFEKFFCKNGMRTLMFYYQPCIVPTATTNIETPSNGANKLFIASGTSQRLTGTCMIFLRNSTESITTLNIAQETNFMNLSCTNGNLYSDIELILQGVLIPSIKSIKDWGDVGENEASEFVDQLGEFTNKISLAKENELGRICLSAGDLHSVLGKMHSLNDYSAAASNVDLLVSIEKLVLTWIKQIEQVLIESQQIRKEADDIGPSDELLYWRKKMAKLNSLLGQIKSSSCRAAIGVLFAAKSQTIKHWKEFDCQITNAANEAKDNMKYLSTLEKIFVPLKKCSPLKMVEHLSTLMNGIQMIYSISQYYNTSERMTSLFVKITNQMITSCKSYIRQDSLALWTNPWNIITSKISECIKLNEEYQKSFQKTKMKLRESHNEKQFEFSETYIFGKFDAFCNRLTKIDDLLKTVESLSALKKIKIEGIENILSHYVDLVSSIKNKNYDILDHRKNDFDADFEKFKLGVDSLQGELQNFIDSWFEKSFTTLQGLEFLDKFKRLLGIDLNLKNKYHKVLFNFTREIDHIKKIYQKQKENPPCFRDMPPISSKIAWSRQLFRQISHPMELLSRCEDLLKTPEANKVVKSYNRVARTLIEFEMVYHENWMKTVEHVKYSLSASLLVRHPETKVFHVNFDPQIFELMKEIKYMQKMSLEVPATAIELQLREPHIRLLHASICKCVEDFAVIKSKIPEVVFSLMQPIIRSTENVFKPGTSVLSWISLNTDIYLQAVKKSLHDLDLVVKRVTDLLKCGIEGTLESIRSIMLCEITDNIMHPSEFHASTERLCKAHSETLNLYCELTEFHTFTLLEMIKKHLKPKQLEELREHDIYPCRLMPDLVCGKGNKGNRCLECSPCNYWNFIFHFNMKTIEALTECVRLSLEFLKRKIYYSSHSIKKLPTFFSGSIVLQIPQVVMKDSLEIIQQWLNKSVQVILKAVENIYEWKYHNYFHPVTNHQTEDAGKGSASVKSVFKIVLEHKEIIKTVSILSSSISSLKVEVANVLEEFKQFQMLWKEEPKFGVSKFLSHNPSLEEFASVFLRYINLESSINILPDNYTVGPIIYSSIPLKVALLNETQTWKQAYGKALAERAYHSMKNILQFIDNTNKQLTRPINDLDDVRSSMAALADIREAEIRVQMEITPIEESYALLSNYGLNEFNDNEHVDNLTYAWKKLQELASSVQQNLQKVQPQFKLNLLSGVKVFKQAVISFYKDYLQKGPMVPGITTQEASERLSIFQIKFDELWRKYQTYSGGEELFGMPVTEYTELQNVKHDLGLLTCFYTLHDSFMDSLNRYYEIQWSEVNIERISLELLDFNKRTKRLPEESKCWPAFIELNKTIEEFIECCPLLEMMSNPALKERHWEQISLVTSYQFPAICSDYFTLRCLMNAPLLKFKEDIEDICISAVKEKDIEAKLQQVIFEWNTHELSFSLFKSRGELLLKGFETSEIISLMEDSLMILGSLLSNRYNAPLKSSIQKWILDLSNTIENIEKWLSVQNLWVYLEAVFVGGDIAKQLPMEAKRFNQIDKSWVKIMNRAHEIQNVVSCCVGDDTLTQLLPHLLEQLEICQKSLCGYLEKKRLIFPRFFFVSDPALLEILGQASDSHTIQSHLLAVFDNVNRVSFDEKHYDKIFEICSKEGEKISLQNPVLASGNVETWLGFLLAESKNSLHHVIRMAKNSISEVNLQLIKFLSSYPAQVSLLGLQMLWTIKSELALSKSKIDRKIMAQTNEYFLAVLNELIGVTTKDITQMERIKFETLVTIHVHQRDIFDDLVNLRIKSISDFEWLKQSRFYFHEESDKCLVSITNVTFVYQNEFLGCTDRLVITPLTDRCYITLAQALHMSMGGAPAGPAGTGKTETVKDMGKALGKYVVVFNCSDQMDYRGLGRIFKGLAQSGSWGCFDEFNRIELPVLSVAAQQIYIVLSAKKEHKNDFVFSDGDIVKLNSEFGLFLTMNPGYAGRQELPENLKVQFRTVAMMVPDRQIIIRVKLASCGFIQNIILSRKFFMLYNLCDQQLSKQVHYDFGLRNILSVLRTLGAAKRINPNDIEEKILMQVLRDMNLSKLIDEDEPLFMSLINDLFPGFTVEKVGYPEIKNAIQKCTTDAKLIFHLPWVDKIIQLYETQLVRHGMMVLGPSGAGKTSCIQILMKSISLCGVPHREMRMNPKAITAPQMFGRLDAATNDWTDGIFSSLWRKTLKLKKGDNVWIVLDGPVDTIWIENLNSVLDDNKTLTLANGDRIPMAPCCKIVFEPHNIDNASPATVSRNGMVYMSSPGLDWKPILKAWLNQLSPLQSDIFEALFNTHFADLHLYVQQNLVSRIKILEHNEINQAINILIGLMPKEDSQHIDKTYLNRLFVFSIMWSLGAVLELIDRKKLEEFIYENYSSALDLPPVKEEETMFEYFIDNDGSWKHWNQEVKEFTLPFDSTLQFSSILVPTVDNTRTHFLIDIIARQGKAVLLIGEQGTAKTVILKNFCSQYNSDEHMYKLMNFSSATLPLLFQRSIESYVDKRVGNTYGPSAGRKMTVFIDDINMPVVNEWGDQITNEIVRQLMECKGMYSIDKPGDFMNISDIQFVAAMVLPGGGRNDIPERLKRHFSIFNCTIPSNASIDKIFQTISCHYFSKEKGFSKEIQDLAYVLVKSTRKLWQFTKQNLLASPAKFHYIFNLRDLSRIWQGMLSIDASTAKNKQIFLNLWKHECCRVISDRFFVKNDVEWFENLITSVVKEDFDTESDITSALLKNEPYFVTFMKGEIGSAHTENVYEPLESIDSVKFQLDKYLKMYNEIVRGSQLDLVFFKDAMVHLIKISRILKTPRSNALLVGVGGSGKQSLTRLASFIAGYSTFQITLTRSYNTPNLIDDLRKLYRIAGQQGKGVTFIFTDNEIKDEVFLEYINSVLASGEISNLFPQDEINEITDELIPVMKQEYPRRPPTLENLYDYFITRAKNNLHVVLCFSPVGDKFRNRALKFPGLLSGCTINWFSPWPTDALIAVSNHFLLKYNVVNSLDIVKPIVTTMGAFHSVVDETCLNYFERFRRQAHVTPKSYLSFISGFRLVYLEKQKEITMLSNRIKTGLEKLDGASKTVVELSQQLDSKEKDIIIASKKADSVLKEVTETAQAAEKVKSAVSIVKDKAQLIFDAISTDKLFAENKLKVAQPALDEAEAALNTIKPAHISNIRKLLKPPHLIMRIMDCILILFNHKMDSVTIDFEKNCVRPSWSESLRMMSQAGFLQSLLSFQKDSINGEMVELMEPYLAAEDYNLDAAKKACGDVAGLLSWTIAMSYFYGINKEVLPLKANLVVQLARLETAQKDLACAEAELNTKQHELDVAQKRFDDAMNEKQMLLDDADLCRLRMANAKALIDGLGGEKHRWTEQSKRYDEQIQRLVGDVLLATAFLSYSGPFNQEFRKFLILLWKKEMRINMITFNEDLSLVTFLTDAASINEWSLQGLPNDELSLQNGIIVSKASRYPLLIDPQGQGKAWIKNKEKNNDLCITSLNQKYFRSHLEDALSLGKPLLLEDVKEELDPVLDNVLEQNYIKSGRGFKVRLGDKEVDVMQGFRLYLTTKLPNPLYTPEVSAKTSIIDFTVTIKGLEDQLLGRVILKEKQELERERLNLIKEVAINHTKMNDLEDNLLHRLTSTKGSLVDDDTLIAVLQTTKQMSEEISEKLSSAKETELKINIALEEYRPVATRGSILYFLVVEMSFVNNMYQTSLRQFLRIFDRALEKSPKSPILLKRISSITEFLTYEVFIYMMRGFFEEHKFLFTLLLALKIDLHSGKIKQEEFDIFIKGGAALDLNIVQPKPKKWIQDVAWLNLVALSKLTQFLQILVQVSNNDKNWKIWFDNLAPEDSVIPDGYNEALDDFRRLLLIRAWCPDRTINQARKYVASSIGVKYVEGILMNLDGTLEESNPLTPMICLLSMGSDPTAAIESLSKRKHLSCRSISMGQGQEVHARRLLQQCTTEGGWVLLQNCHLGLNFMDELYDMLTTLESAHENFRLWMTTEVHPKFPINLLQISIKFTNEPPSGIKDGLKRTYVGMTQDQLDIVSLYQWKPLLYATAFLHSVVQERRKFGPLGWNIPYEFNMSDLSSSLQFVQNHLDELDFAKGVSWPTLCYMLGEVNYGGRVTDEYDKRLLNTFCLEWFNENLFNEKFEFHHGYGLPKCEQLTDILIYIQNLPAVDTPEVFGLHPNADITYQTKAAVDVLNTILNVQPKDKISSLGETKESSVYRIAEDMLKKLPSDYIPHEVRTRLQKMGQFLPMLIFLRQELTCMQRIITVVRHTLNDLLLAIDGTIIMSNDLRDALDKIYNARIPFSWQKISWPSSTLGFWFTELIERNQQFSTWLFQGRPNLFWMTGFFNPQGFITAMRQEITRAHKGWSLDTVVLANEVTRLFKEDMTSPPTEGVYIYGLYLDGCSWDRRNFRLIESQSKMLFTPLPVVHLFASNAAIVKDVRFYLCPVYKTPQRTDLTYIFSLNLKTNINPNHWILRGVALLCDVKG